MFLRFGVLLLLLVCAGELPAQTGPRKTTVRIIYSALTASNGPVWVAADQGLFEKHGLDVQIVHGRGASPIQALAGGTVELGFLSLRRLITSCFRSGRARTRRLKPSRIWRGEASA